MNSQDINKTASSEVIETPELDLPRRNLLRKLVPAVVLLVSKELKAKEDKIYLRGLAKASLSKHLQGIPDGAIRAGLKEKTSKTGRRRRWVAQVCRSIIEWKSEINA